MRAKPALIGGAWGMGSMLLFSTMFSGMAGMPSGEGWEQGSDAGGGGGDMGGMDGGGMDFGGGFDF